MSLTPRTTFTSEAPNDGTAVDIEYEDGGLLWDDGSGVLWDDGSEVLWSHIVSTYPDVSFSFSLPRTNYSGEVEE